MIISGKRKYELQSFIELLTKLLNQQDISMEEYGRIYDRVMNSQVGYFQNGNQHRESEAHALFKESISEILVDDITEEEKLFLDFVKIIFGESMMIGFEDYMVVVKASSGLKIKPARREQIIRNILKLKIL
jgi:hypothetical protein